jgi:putative membrane protein
MPSIAVVWALGLALAFSLHAWGEGWLYAKLALVIGLSGYHGYLASYARKLAKGERALSGRQLRLLNEVPGVAAALIVILVVVKPF